MAFTFVGGTGASSTGSTTTNSTVVTGVQAGDLVVAFVKNESGATTVTISDGTSSFTGLTQRTRAGAQTCQLFYLLSSVATGSVTYTSTFSVAKDWKRIIVLVFRPTGTVTFQTGTDVYGEGASTAVASAAYSLTGTGSWICVGSYGEFSGDTTSLEKINAVAADGSVNATEAEFWYKIVSATFTGGTSSATLSGASDWVCNAAAFNDAGGGGGDTFANNGSLRFM